MKCYLQKCDAACGECADRIPKAMFDVFTIKNFDYIAEDIGNILISVGHSFFKKGYSDSELRNAISEKIEDLVSSGACKLGTNELLIANKATFYMEMSRCNSQPCNFDDGCIYLKHEIWYTSYRTYTRNIDVEGTIKWNKNAIECSKNVMNAIYALLEAYNPEKSWEEIKIDPLYSEYIDICQNLHYSIDMYQDVIQDLSFSKALK